MPKKTSACLLFVALAAGCSSSTGEEEEVKSSASSPLVCGASIGRGQCVVAVQSFYARFGVTVGIAPSVARTDAQGRWCASEGACLLWVDDVPSRYGWVRTWNPGPFDIAVFPPEGTNYWGHVTIVDHVDGAGVWMIDANDDGYEDPNNTPHLHYRAPYGYYTYTGKAALGCGGSAKPSAPASGSGANCVGYNNGLYCGSDYVHGDASTLYRCSGGVAYVEEVCANGCHVAPDGTNDACAQAPAPAADPPPAPAPANCAGYYDALYCGSNYVHGDPNVLYRCAGGVASVAQSCANGCQIAPDGHDDYCN